MPAKTDRAARFRRLSAPLSLGLIAALLVALGFVSMDNARPHAAHAATADNTPLLAYYYIWFDSGSWDRAKIDTPLLGTYSSDDEAVMRRHIEMAKAAGIDGFLVSWKSSDQLNARLESLMRVADDEGFKLGIVYEGLDFNRNPLPASRVGSDLQYFAAHYASDPAFRIFDRPLVIWSGTWSYSPEEIGSVTAPLRSQLLLLASEKNVDGYKRIADLVDGDAYYWSSVNPYTNKTYASKLQQMGQSVHGQDGLWIAPAAPGFNAKMVGGSSDVPRNDGDTLRRELSVAASSVPDAIGLISWNEFSENTYIEPSKQFGSRYLDVLTAANHAQATGTLSAPAGANDPVDSSSPAGDANKYQIAVLAAIGFVCVTAVVMVIRR
jgi:hypothetical protein